MSAFSCFSRNADSYKPLPQGAVSHSLCADSLLEQRSLGPRQWMSLWFPALNGVLLVTITTEFSLPFIRPVAQQVSSFIPTNCLVILLCFWCMYIFTFFFWRLLLPFNFLYINVVSKCKFTMSIAPIFNFQNIYFFINMIIQKFYNVQQS